MTIKTIAVDIDDVLAAHAETFVEFSNTYYGTSLEVDDYTDHWNEIWQVDTMERERRAKDFMRQADVMNFQSKINADKVLTRLSHDFILVIVTARPIERADITRKWLDQHFRGLFKDVHYVPAWISDKKTTKAEICLQIGADILIDDSLQHCEPAAAAGIECLLFGSFKWNLAAKLPKNIARAKNWLEVEEYFYGSK